MTYRLELRGYEDNDTEAELRLKTRSVILEKENEALRAENKRLERINARLRKQLAGAIPGRR